MTKCSRCKDCKFNTPLGKETSICKTCVYGTHFQPNERSKIYYESVREMNQPPKAYRDMIERQSNDISIVPEIQNVIFKEPATIVFWADGTKTVVKAVYDEFDPEKGLAMAITKKALGNKGKYFNTIKKWTDEYLEKENK